MNEPAFITREAAVPLTPTLSPKGRREAVLWLALFLVLAALAPAQQPAVGRVKNFIVPDYDAQNRKKAVLMGAEAVADTNNVWQITALKIESFTPEEKVSWIVEAPTCFYKDMVKVAYSPGPITARSADSQLTITGQGFEWRHTAQQLRISNAVRTVIHPAAKTNATTAAGLARQDFQITAQEFRFNAQTYEAVYQGQVEARELLPANATNAAMVLNCGLVTVNLGPGGGGLREIQAEHDVRFQQGATRASGGKAVYTASNEVIRLTTMARWETELAEGSGDVLVLDRTNNVFQALGNARARLRPALAGAPISASATNEAVEVFADTLTAKLPPRGQAVAELAAEGRVQVTRGDQRANGERLVYAGAATNGQAVLTGNPRWQTPEAAGQADRLVFERGRNEFSGQGNGYVRLRRAATNAPSQELEAWADRYEFKGDTAALSGNVRVQDPQWRLSCGEVTLQNAPGTNRLDHVIARQQIRVEQRLPAGAKQVPWKLACRQLRMDLAADGRGIGRIIAEEEIVIEPARAAAPGESSLPWRLACDRMTLGMSPKNGQIESVLAENRIRLEPVAAAPSAANDFPWALDCERMTLFMAPGRTNQVERVLAEGQVRVEQTALARNTGGGLWRLACDRALLRMSGTGGNQISAAEAERNVRVTQLTSNGQHAAWTLLSEKASLKMAASNRVQEVTASDNVRIEQGFTTNGAPMRLRCEWVSMGLSTSNTVRTLAAQKRVVIEQGASRAAGEFGTYDAATEDVQLRGGPVLVYVDDRLTNQPPQRIEVEGAEVLTWNRVSNHFRGKGPYRIIPKGAFKPNL